MRRSIGISLLLGATFSTASLPPTALGFRQFYKCPSDADVLHLGDTGTPAACLIACESHPNGAGCWWLDGTNGFPRECRLCRTLSPVKKVWPNDWGVRLSGAPIA